MVPAGREGKFDGGVDRRSPPLNPEPDNIETSAQCPPGTSHRIDLSPEQEAPLFRTPCQASREDGSPWC